MKKSMYSTSEVGQWVGVFHTTVRRWIENRTIKGFKIGRNYKIPAEEVIRLMVEYEIPIPDILKSRHGDLIEKRQQRHGKERGNESFLKKLLVVDRIKSPAAVCRGEVILGTNSPFAGLFELSPVEIIGHHINEFFFDLPEEKISDFARKVVKQRSSNPPEYYTRLVSAEGRDARARLRVSSLNQSDDVYLLIVHEV